MFTKNLLIVVVSIFPVIASAAPAKTFYCLDAGMVDFSQKIPFANGKALVDGQRVKANLRPTYDLQGRPETLMTIYSGGWHLSKICLPALQN